MNYSQFFTMYDICQKLCNLEDCQLSLFLLLLSILGSDNTYSRNHNLAVLPVDSNLLVPYNGKNPMLSEPLFGPALLLSKSGALMALVVGIGYCGRD